MQKITLLYGKIHYTLSTEYFIDQSTVLVVKGVEILFF